MRHMHALRDVFFDRLRANLDNGSGIVTSEQLNVIFGNFVNVLSLNEELLRDIEKAWNATDSVTENVFNVALCFIKITPFFRAYSVYAANHSKAIAEVIKLRKERAFSMGFSCPHMQIRV